MLYDSIAVRYGLKFSLLGVVNHKFMVVAYGILFIFQIIIELP